MMVAFAATWVVLLCLISFGTSEAAPQSLVNCNEVTDTDRCACNERILLALTQLRRIVPDPTQFGSAAEANTAIIIQQHQQHRLRTFYAPACGKASPDLLPTPEQHTGGQLDLKAIEKHLRPLRTMTIDPPNEPSDGSPNRLSDTLSGKLSDTPPYRLLIGRWDGWQTIFDSKPSAVSLHVISLDQTQHFVKACSDQGMVFLRVKNGYLEWPRVDSLGLAYSIRLWTSSAPYTHDLEGVTLLEIRPGEVVVAGLVRLARVLMFDWSTPPSAYFCQDRDLEEQKRMVREEQERERRENEKLLFIELKEEIQQLRRELEAGREKRP